MSTDLHSSIRAWLHTAGNRERREIRDLKWRARVSFGRQVFSERLRRGSSYLTVVGKLYKLLMITSGLGTCPEEFLKGFVVL